MVTVPGSAAAGWLCGTLGATGTVANSRRRKAVITAITPNTKVVSVTITSNIARFRLSFPMYALLPFYLIISRLPRTALISTSANPALHVITTHLVQG